jgi:putative transposase
MPQSYTRLVYHIIFSTKDREPLISDDIKPQLFSYMGGIFRKLDSVAFAINGMPDHVHILAALPPTEAVADIVGKVKSNSSKWVHEKWPQHKRFAWQNGYGSFTVSISRRRASKGTSRTRKDIITADRSRRSFSGF